MAAQQDPPKTAAKPAKPGDPKTPADAKASGDAKKAPRSRGKLVLLLAIVLLMVGGGGAGAYVFMSGSDESAESADKAQEQPAIFVPLETFTVNLLPTGDLQQYLQTNVTLKLTSQTTADAVKNRMPEVRNRILLILSAKRPNELMPVAGKQQLAAEISEAMQGMVERPKAAEATSAPVAESAAANGNGASARPPVEVLFTGFIIQ
jgi:flagellar protein FliL